MSEPTAHPPTTAAPETPPQPEIRLERIPCPLCGSPNSHVIVETEDHLCGIPGVFHIEQCEHCRHRFMNPRPAAASLGDCYPPHYGPHRQSSIRSAPDTPGHATAGTTSANTRQQASDRPLILRILPLRFVPGLRRIYDWLMDDRSQPAPTPSEVNSELTTPDSHGPRAFELGCATGCYLQVLQQKGWSVTGVEPGSVPAAAAQKAGLDVKCGTLESCEIPGDTFDLAAAWMVIEHVPDCRKTLLGMGRILKPGGELLISIPNAGCWEPRVFGRHWYAWEPPRHLHHFTPQSIRQLLSDCGFTSIRITHQRSLSYVIGSLGLVMLSKKPNGRIGRWLVDYPDRPRLLPQVLLAALAHAAALLRQGGRLTIAARRAMDSGKP